MNTKKILDQIIPDNVRDRCVYIGQTLSRGNWETGDIANFCKALVRERGYEINDMEIYQYLADLEGSSESSVRHAAYVAAFYPEPVRSDFEVLPFSHFQYAMQFRDGWRDVLETSLRGIETNGGKPRSLRWLSSLFEVRIEPEVGGPGPEEDTILAQAVEAANDAQQAEAMVQANAGPGVSSQVAPAVAQPLTKSASRYVIENLLRVISFFRTAAMTLPVSEETRISFQASVDDFEKLILRVEQEITDGAGNK